MATDRVHRKAGGLAVAAAADDDDDGWDGGGSEVEDTAVVGCKPTKNSQVPVDGFVVVTSARPWKLQLPASWSANWK